MFREPLNALLAHDQWWASMSTIVVFGGLVIDLAAVLISSPKEKSRRLETILSLVGVLTIALGVLGEWHFETRAASEGKNLQSLSDQKVAQLNADSARLRQQNLQLGQQLTQTKQTLAQTEMAAAQAQKEAAKAELGLAKLKEPRALGRSQAGQLIAELKPFAGTQILVVYDGDGGDMEPVGFAVQLMSVLRKSGWKVDEDATGRLEDSTGRAVGLKVTERPGINVSQFGIFKLPSGGEVQYAFAKAAGALYEALNKLGLLNTGPGQLDLVSDNPNARVIMVVGRKL